MVKLWVFFVFDIKIGLKDLTIISSPYTWSESSIGYKKTDHLYNSKDFFHPKNKSVATNSKASLHKKEMTFGNLCTTGRNGNWK